MQAETVVTYDLTPPARPVADDMGGSQKKNVDPPRTPPDPVRSVTAQDWNQVVQQVAALAKVAPVAIITIKWTGMVAGIEQVAGMGTKARKASTYTVTTLGTGLVRVAWPLGTFPGRVCRPVARLASLIALGTGSCIVFMENDHSILVTLLDDTGGSSGGPFGDFVLYLYG